MSDRSEPDGADHDMPSAGTEQEMDSPDSADSSEDNQTTDDREGQSMDTGNSGQPVPVDKPAKTAPIPLPDLPQYDKLTAPKVNCPEKIIIAIDATSEANSLSFMARSVPERTMFQLLRKAIKTFVRTKTKINAKHEYALAVLEENAAVFHQFTNESEEICQALEHLKPSENKPFESFDLGSLVHVVNDLVQLPVVEEINLPPPYIVRLIIIYSRSHSMPSLSDQGVKDLVELLQSPYFFLDLFYTHEKPSDLNHCEAIYDQFCDLDQHEMGYMLEVSRSTTRLFDHMAKLIAHPLQRVSQRHSYYKLSKQTDEGELV